MPPRTATRLVNPFDPGVRHVGLMLTTGCNLHCAYCNQRRAGARTMPLDVLDGAVLRLVSSRLERPQLTLFGGEPLLAAPLVQRALDRVREWAPPWMRPDVRIVTNGTRLDEETLGLLVRRDVFITISFDGVARAQDARAPGIFKALDGLLLRIARDHPEHFRNRVAVKMTLTPDNVPCLSDSFRYFLSRGVRNVDLAPAFLSDARWSARQASELGRQFAAVVRLSAAELGRSGEISFTAFRIREDIPLGGPACACGSHGLVFVDVDGALAPCSGLVPSTLEPRPAALRRVVAALGGVHVNDADLPAALRRREARARRLGFLRRPVDRPETRRRCLRCAARATCLVCPIAIVSAGRHVPAFHCDLNRLLAKHRSGLRPPIPLTHPSARPGS